MNISIHALLAESDQQPNNQEHPSSLFLSTLSLRRATKLQDCRNSQNIISIHALLAESDRRFRAIHNAEIDISIHALLAESDDTSGATNRIFSAFLSTLSLRRATLAAWKPDYICRDFYPRSPCGERPTQGRANAARIAFLSTLSLRRATLCNMACRCMTIFLSTLSLRRATVFSIGQFSTDTISIHALLAESDIVEEAITFYPPKFLSTLSLRRATRAG